MVIVLDLINDVETTYDDFVESLEECENGIRCCLDVDFLLFNKHTTAIKDIRLIPLDNFSCQRTISGCNGTKIMVESTFGLIRNDFISFGLREVTIVEDDGYKGLGLLVSSDNLYYDIVVELSKHFNFIKGSDFEHSFILNESEISKLNLVPFNLTYFDGSFWVDNIESEMKPSEYDAIIHNLYCSDCAL